MPRLKINTKEISNAKRNEIVECAIELFLEINIDEVNVDLISQKAGIGRTLFYHYFKNKDALLEATVLYIEDKFFHDLVADLRFPKRTFLSICRAYINEINKDSSIFLIDLAIQISARLDSVSNIRIPVATMFYLVKQSFKELNDDGLLIYNLKESFNIFLLLIQGAIKNRIDTGNPININANQILKILIRDI